MTLFELIEHIQNLGCSEPNVRFVSLGDIYELNKRQDIDYPAFVVTQGVNYGSTEEGTETYGITMFLVDRLTSDKSNEIDIQSWADTGLKNIISRIEEHNIGIIQGQYTVQTFTERFDSLCAGAFVLVNIKVDVLDCDSGTEKIRLVTSVNGQTGDVIVKGLEGAVVYSVNGQVGDVVLDIPDVTDFVTNSSVSNNYAKKSSLNNYLLKTEYTAPDVTKSYVDNKISDISANISDNYAKKSSLNDYLPKSEYVKPDVTKQYVDNKISDLNSSVSANYAKKTSLNDYLPKSEYVKPDVTKQYVDNKISDLSNTYATKTSLNRYLLIADYTAPDVTKRYVDVQDQKLATDIYDLSTLTNRRINNISDSIDGKILDISKGLNYKIIDISNNIDSKFTNLNIDIYNKFDILSDDIADQILEIDSKVENIQTDLNNKISDLDNKVDGIDSKIDDLSTNVNDISTRVNDISNNVNDLSTNISSDISDIYSKINNISTNIVLNVSNLDSSIVLNYVNKTDFNNKLTEYYNKTEIDNKIIDLGNIYYNKTEINNKLENYSLKTDIPDVTHFVTDSSVSDNYAKKSDIPDVTHFVTDSSVSDNYAKKTDIPLIPTDYVHISDYNKYVLDQNIIDTAQNEALDLLTADLSDLGQEIGLKQDKLVSGNNIKTLNGESLLGSGNITIEADLHNYYNKTEVDSKFTDLNSSISNNYPSWVDMREYYWTSGEVTTNVQLQVNNRLRNYYNMTDVDNLFKDSSNFTADYYYKRRDIDRMLEDYCLKTDIPDVTKLDSSIKQIWSGCVELSEFIEDVSTRLDDVSTDLKNASTRIDYLSVILNYNYYTKTLIDTTLNSYALKTDIPDVTLVNSSINNIENSLTGYSAYIENVSTRLKDVSNNMLTKSIFVYNSDTKTLDITVI